MNIEDFHLIGDKILVGVKEDIDLPNLGLQGVTTRIDTGAQTSALHVDHISEDVDNGIVYFEFHPDFHDIDKTIQCSAKLHDSRIVKSSNGTKEKRFVIRTVAKLGSLEWDIELTLTDRSSMNHLMLLGREALQAHFLVDPAKDFLASGPGKSSA
ncbi:ATP-dependent zinc protease [Aestuariibacter salexigens]|uniref:ATP-dependent zinc protease family protein n=1 Tax=Aestuariibacter salexigens TaxID=226010 RepID=UPI0004262AD1|nr:RimK/LysX family protein [Aestuariibacter salexigens]